MKEDILPNQPRIYRSTSTIQLSSSTSPKAIVPTSYHNGHSSTALYRHNSNSSLNTSSNTLHSILRPSRSSYHINHEGSPCDWSPFRTMQSKFRNSISSCSTVSSTCSSIEELANSPVEKNVYDAKTGTYLSPAEAFERKLIDLSTFNRLKKQSAVTWSRSISTPETHQRRRHSHHGRRYVVTDPSTGEKLRLRAALSRGLISEETYRKFRSEEKMGNLAPENLRTSPRIEIHVKNSDSPLTVDSAFEMGVINRSQYEGIIRKARSSQNFVTERFHYSEKF